MPPHLITAALPYANGSIHIGHLLEYIQADIHARFLRLIGHEALFICASDMHGSPIEIKAAAVGLAPEEFARRYYLEHQQTFKDYQISFDHYYHTHSPENRELSEYFFYELKKQGHIYLKTIKVVYCSSCDRYLPDRYVKGECPKCHTPDQYGDVCESCSSILKGFDLLNPRCSLCDHPPIHKDSQHYFFKLSSFQDKLTAWINNPHSRIQSEIKNWLSQWLSRGLDDWCISRDAPYFGFEIPGSLDDTGEKKYFYVWLDAPIGYISSTKHFLDQTKTPWQDYWKYGSIHHHIGKDIIYFHFLFWPAMLSALSIPFPRITVHSFVTVNGEKMSKSRGTFFTAADFQKLYPIESLRFYFASHLDTSLVDIDLSFSTLQALNNNVLLGNLANFCYRTLTFAQRNYGKIDSVGIPKAQQLQTDALIAEIKNNYLHLDYKSAVKNILRLSDIGNSIFQQAVPWKTPHDPHTRATVGFCVNLARNLAILILPIIPSTSLKILSCTQQSDNISWTDISFSWKGILRAPPLLVTKIEHLPRSQHDPSTPSKPLPPSSESSPKSSQSSSPICPLRLLSGTVIDIKDHPQAERLYILNVDFGSAIQPRYLQVISGLKGLGFTPNRLHHNNILFLLNLKSSIIRGEKSSAMMLTAEGSGSAAGKIYPLFTQAPAGTSATFPGYTHSDKQIQLSDFSRLPIKIENNKVILNGQALQAAGQDIIVKEISHGKIS